MSAHVPSSPTPLSKSETSSPLHSYLLSLPEFQSPARVQSLYSDLGRQKISNPAGYTGNLSWWRNTLVKIVEKGAFGDDGGDRLVLKVDQALSDALRLERGGRPAGLGTVIDDLAQEGLLQPLQYFLTSSVSIYESTSLVGRVADLLLKKSFWWAMERFSLVNPREEENTSDRWRRVQGSYVVIPVLEKVAKAVIASQDEKPSLSLSDSLYSIEGFKRYAERCSSSVFSFSSLSETDIKVLLKYLERDRRVIVVHGEVVKFAEEPISQEITSIDRGVLELKTTIERVEQQIEHIQSSITTRTAQIKAALLASRKEIAKLQLSSRHSLQTLLSQRLGTLQTLQAALASIDQAHGDREIMKAYETSSKVLREVMSKPEMQRERVEEVMDRLREGMEGAEEIRKAVEEGGWEVVEAAGATVDEDELAEELEAIVKEEKAKEEEARKRDEEKRILELSKKLEGETLNEKLSGTHIKERMAEVA